MNKQTGFLSLFSVGIIYGVFAIITRIITREITPFQQLLTAYFVGFVISLILIFAGKISIPFSKINKSVLVLYSIIYAVSYVFNFLAIINTKINIAVFTFYASSLLLSLLINVLFYKETINLKRSISLILMIAGLIFFTYPFTSFNNLGFIFAVISGSLEGVSNFLRKYLSSKMNQPSLISLQMIGGFIFISFLILFLKQNFTFSISSQGLLLLLFFSFFFTLVNYLAIIGFSNFDLNLGTIIISSDMVFATILAAVIFKEIPILKELIGSLLIVSAIIIPNLNLRKKYEKTT